MGLISEFREFAIKGNMIDMAVGIIIGAAFGTVVKSLVDDVIMPPIGLLTGGIDFSDKAVVLQKGAEAVGDTPAVAEVALNYGVFLNNIISFLIVAFAVFIIVKMINTAKKRFEEEQAAAPPKPDPQVTLLTEIRDTLQSKA